MTQYKFYTCDVFTDTRFGGNQLAVLPDATGLTADQMQAITAEFNYAESTFIFPPEAGGTKRVRIFNRVTEMGFAGHPNIGTAFVLAVQGELGEWDDELQVTFEEGAGPVDIQIRRLADGHVWCELKAPQQLQTSQVQPTGRIADILGLRVAQIETRHHLPQTASVGMPYMVTEVVDREALSQVNINIESLRALVSEGVRGSMYVYTRGDDDFDIYCRMISPLSNNFGDPATGSANCALAGLLTKLAPEDDGDFAWRISQGTEVGRPSILDARTEKRNGEVTGVWIAGTSVMVSEGFITV